MLCEYDGQQSAVPGVPVFTKAVTVVTCGRARVVRVPPYPP